MASELLLVEGIPFFFLLKNSKEAEELARMTPLLVGKAGLILPYGSEDGVVVVFGVEAGFVEVTTLVVGGWSVMNRL